MHPNSNPNLRDAPVASHYGQDGQIHAPGERCAPLPAQVPVTLGQPGPISGPLETNTDARKLSRQPRLQRVPGARGRIWPLGTVPAPPPPPTQSCPAAAGCGALPGPYRVLPASDLCEEPVRPVLQRAGGAQGDARGRRADRCPKDPGPTEPLPETYGNPHHAPIRATTGCSLPLTCVLHPGPGSLNFSQNSGRLNWGKFRKP